MFCVIMLVSRAVPIDMTTNLCANFKYFPLLLPRDQVIRLVVAGMVIIRLFIPTSLHSLFSTCINMCAVETFSSRSL